MSLDRHQLEVLQIAMGLPEAASLALAGGGAMLVHGLVERPTADLDLFTPLQTAIAPAARALHDALTARGYQVTVTQQQPTYVQLEVTSVGGTTHVELAQDARQHEPVTVAGARVLAADDVAASKTLALFGRAAARDLVDIDALTRRYSPAALLDLAAASDPGFDVPVFCRALAVAAQRPEAAFTELGISAVEVRRLQQWAAIWAAELQQEGADRWPAALATVDPRLPGDAHAAALVAALTRMNDAGDNVSGLLAACAQPALPAGHPGRALHYRLLQHTPTQP